MPVFRWLLVAAWMAAAGLSGVTCTPRMQASPVAGLPDIAMPTDVEEELAGMLPDDKRRLVASLRRTPCFGSCPVFSVEVWSDGRVNWQGESHVARIGSFSTQVSAEWIAELLREGERAGFFELAAQYPNGSLVPDLPQTILMLRRGKKSYRVIDNADSPLALQRFERYWQEKIENLNWRPVEQ